LFFNIKTYTDFWKNRRIGTLSGKLLSLSMKLTTFAIKMTLELDALQTTKVHASNNKRQNVGAASVRLGR
jgi:hypothetical protein